VHAVIFRRALVLGLASALTLAAAAQSESLDLDCDPAIEASGGATGYTKRAGDWRCEGIYERTVSATGLELVSATIGPIEFDAAQHEAALIEVPAFADAAEEPIRVHVVGLSLGLPYRLDALAEPGATLRWPLGDVVAPWGLKSTDVGALGVVVIDRERQVVPLRVAAPKATTAGQSINLVLRSPVELERVWWRELRPDGATDYREIASDVYGGDPISLSLPGDGGRPMRLEFQAQLARSLQYRSLELVLQRPE
jgi:hypothetical protein